MMKILFRLGMILLVCVLTAGGLYLALNVSGADIPKGGGRPPMEQFNPSGAGEAPSMQNRPAPPPGGFKGRGHENEGFSVFGLAGVFMQAVKVALITLVVAGVQVIFNRIRRKPAPA